MPGRNTNLPPGSKHTGWYRDGLNNVLEWYHNGTKIGQASGSTVTFSGTVAASTLTATTTLAGTSFTASTGDINVTAGNLRLGVVSAFASTEPTSAVVMKVGTAPAGAITTSGGVFSSSTVVQKIIANGTVSNVET